MAHDFNLAVNAIIIKNNKVLLVKRKDRDMWRLPGGELRTGETIDEAIINIIREKLGLDIEIKRVVGLYSKPIQNELVVLFDVENKIPEQHPLPTGNFVAADFFSLDNLPSNLPDKNFERVKDFEKKISEVVLRTQMSAPSSLKFPTLKQKE